MMKKSMKIVAVLVGVHLTAGTEEQSLVNSNTHWHLCKYRIHIINLGICFMFKDNSSIGHYGPL